MLRPALIGTQARLGCWIAHGLKTLAQFCVYGDPEGTAADSSDWNTAFVVDSLPKAAFEARWKGAEAVDWAGVDGSLDTQGFAPLPVILEPSECDLLAALYSEDARFRSRIDMSRFRFGVGEYKYFAAPLPALVQSLRETLYARLAPASNRWQVRLKPDTTDIFPASLDAFLAQCHDAGQTRPTPLLLSYAAGGYNCLHQDLYGEIAFPLQLVVMLGQPGDDWDGGEFILVENVPRAQSRAEVITAPQGHGIVFTTRYRPVKGSRGWYRVTMRHGVSRVRRGTRYTLGIIYHDAK